MQYIINSCLNTGLPQTSIDFYKKLKKNGFYPKVIYDIGSSAMHFTIVAKQIWPESKIYLFEANEECSFLYNDLDYHIGVLSDEDGKEVKYWMSDEHFGGNSYYRETHSRDAFTRSKVVKTERLDTVVKKNNYPLPDLVKIDCQGAEMDIIKGGLETLKNCPSLIIECQHVSYNEGAPLEKEVVKYVEEQGFKFQEKFSETKYDGDYYFLKN
jgi:FkbM family methyltransferase